MKSIVYGATIRGNSHYTSGRECQDSNSFSEKDLLEDEIRVVVLSDGHGGSTYGRSARGARFATEVTRKELYDFVVENKAIFDAMEPSKKKDQSAETDAKNVEENNNETPIPNDDAKQEEGNAVSDDHEDVLGFGEEDGAEKNPETSGTTSDDAFMDDALGSFGKDKGCGDASFEFGAKDLSGASPVSEGQRIAALGEQLREKLAALRLKIVSEWRKAVDEDLKNESISVIDAELKMISSLSKEPESVEFTGYGSFEDGKVNFVNTDLRRDIKERLIANPRQLYGATLIAAVQYKQHIIIMQVGDGDVVIINHDGSEDFPIPSDNLIGNTTYSLCQDNVIANFKVNYMRRDVKMIMLSTDGIEKSFEEEETLGGVANYISKNIGPKAKMFRASFKTFLRKFSNRYPKDDCSIGFILNGVDDETYEIIKNSPEADEPAEVVEKLESLRRAVFEKYEANKELYSYKASEDKELPVSDVKFYKVGVNAIKSCFMRARYRDVYRTLYKDADIKNDSVFGESEEDTYRIANEKLKELNEEQILSYRIAIDKLMDENPLFIAKFTDNAMGISYNGEFKCLSSVPKYALVYATDDKTVEFIEITDKVYENIQKDLWMYVTFSGVLKIKKDLKIKGKLKPGNIIKYRIDKFDITFHKGDK